MTYQFAVRAGLAEPEVGHPFVKGQMLLGSFDYEPVYGPIVYPDKPALGEFEPFDELPKSSENFGHDGYVHCSGRSDWFKWPEHARENHFLPDVQGLSESEIERRLTFIKAFFKRYTPEIRLRIRDKEYLYGLKLTRHEIYVLYQAYLCYSMKSLKPVPSIWEEMENPEESPEEYFERQVRNRHVVPDPDNPFLPGENLFERFGKEMV